MINFNFSITNPWSDRFSNLWCRAYDTPFKHKFIELELIKCSTIISFKFNWTGQRDHAGLSAEIVPFPVGKHDEVFETKLLAKTKGSTKINYEKISIKEKENIIKLLNETKNKTL